jgi:hypothetical protein
VKEAQERAFNVKIFEIGTKSGKICVTRAITTSVQRDFSLSPMISAVFSLRV